MQQPFRLVRSRNGIQGRVLDPRDPNRRTFGRWAATVLTARRFCFTEQGGVRGQALWPQFAHPRDAERER